MQDDNFSRIDDKAISSEQDHSPDLATDVVVMPAGSDGPGAAVPCDGVDVEAALKFLSAFGSHGAVAFEDGKCLHPKTQVQVDVRHFLLENKHRDIYFNPASLRPNFLGKPKKSDCIGSAWAWVDIDPPKTMTDSTELSRWRDETLAQIEGSDLPPAHFVVFSGRGLWLYWRLPMQMNSKDVEAINYGLAERLGADKCHSIDHLARLPYTRNSKTGLVGTVIRSEPGYVKVERLPSVQPPAAGDTDIEIGDLGEFQPVASVEEFHQLVRSLDCPELKKDDLILSALHPEAANALRTEKLDTSDRSAVMFSWAIKAAMAGMCPSDIRDCILSPALGAISAHLLDPAKVSPDRRELEAERHVRNAVAKAAEYRAAADKPETGAEQELEEPAEVAELVSLAPVPSDLPARPWLVDNLLMNGQVTMITGRGGEGKSLLAIQLAMMVAYNAEFAWWRPRARRNVLVVNAEDNLDELRRRLLGACEVMGFDQRMLENKLFTLNTERLVLLHRDPADDKLKSTDLFKQLTTLIHERSIGLLVVDPLIETHAGLDENSNADMKELILHLRKLARMCEISVLVVHHSRKGATAGDQDGARGGSALVNACRIVATLERMTAEEHGTVKPPQPKERYVRVTGAKANYAGRIGDRWMELVPVTLPNGDETPGFKQVVFGTIDEGFDPETWEHLEELLRLVQVGRGQDRLWSTAATGPTAARLDIAVADRFGLDAGQAREILLRMEKAGQIGRAMQKDNDRKSRKVWIVPGQELPPGTKQLELEPF